ncbi:MAG: ABC transporter substrate-binding protein [Treponema sp.]|nr:ABC transporter substrate-binding protein [Treponema sp.]
MSKRVSKTLLMTILIALGAGMITANLHAFPNSDRSGQLRYGFASEPQTLDPLSNTNTADGRSILFNVFEGLIKPDHTGRLLPAVAEAYRIEENGRSYIFTLRQGIRFHDGSLVTVQDVVFSLETARRAGFRNYNLIDTISATGSREVTVRLLNPDPEFLPFLTAGIVQASNANREQNPIGTGPFMIERYSPQQNLILQRNPHYWQQGIPRLDQVTIVFAADSTALLTGLLGGNIDGAGIDGDLLAQLESAGRRSPRFDAFPQYSNMVQLFALNNAVAPLNDIRVRQAINYALDIQGIIDIAFDGRGEPSGSPVIPGLSTVYNTNLRNPYPRDLARARSLLSAAGYPNGFPLEIVVPSNLVMHVNTAQVIATQLSAVGINVSIRTVDWATWLADNFRGRNFQGTIISLDAANVSVRNFLDRYRSGDNGNFINFNSPEYDRVYGAALTELNEARRIALYQEAQQILSDNAASVYIQDILGYRVFREGMFGGVQDHPLGVIDLSTIYRR